MFKIVFKHRNSTQSMVAFMSVSNILSNVITMASGLFVAKWLLPEQLGFFNGLSIVTSYIILSQLGIPSGLSRELPYYMGKDEPGKAKQVAAVSNFYELCLGGVLFLLALVICIVFLFTKNYLYAAGTFVVGVTAFEGVYVTKYLKVLYRSNNDFNKLSIINIIVSITGAISVLLVWKLAFYGLCLRAIVVFAINFYLTWKWRPIDVKPRWNYAVFSKILKVGMPIYWVANVYSLWPTLQRTAVISFLGVKAMGLYALALMVQNSMNIITTSLASVTFPKMSHSWGRGSSIKELLSKPSKIILATFLLNVFVAIAGWFFIPIFVESFLENYVGGIRAAQWMVLVGVVSVFSVYSNVYMVIQKNTDRLISYVSAMAMWAVSLLFLLKMYGPMLEIIPMSLLSAYLTMYLVNGLHFAKYTKSEVLTCSGLEKKPC